MVTTINISSLNTKMHICQLYVNNKCSINDRRLGSKIVATSPPGSASFTRERLTERVKVRFY